MTPAQKQRFVISQLEPKDYALHLIKKRYKQPQKQFSCLKQLWGKESAWNYKAKSPTHDYGIPQRHMKHQSSDRRLYAAPTHPDSMGARLYRAPIRQSLQSITILALKS
jgi:hypothetical protein